MSTTQSKHGTAATGNRVLNIVESAYRATLEEQDDTVVWISHALRGAGADVHLLLKGNATNYAIRHQQAAKLSFGEWQQTHPPDLAGDIQKFIAKGGAVYLVQEDAAERGIEHADVIEGIGTIDAAGLPGLFEQYDHVWHW